MNYDIVHNGWALNETPIGEDQILDKLEKWQLLFRPLEVRISEIETQVRSRKNNFRRADIR